MKKITKTNQLPPEFTLKKYDTISSLTPEDWSNNLHDQAITIHLLQQGHKNPDQPDCDFGIYHCNDSNQNNFYDRSKKYNNTELTELTNTDTVKFLNIRDSLEVWNTVEYDNELKRAILYPIRNTINLSQALELYNERPLFGGESVAVTLDILASDEQLIRDIKSFVTKYRRILKITPPSPLIVPNEKNICNWTRWRIIQFLDLHIWELTNDKKISYPLLGDILFPDEHEISTSERVRNTVEPNAMKIIKAINDYFDQVGTRDESSWLTKDELVFRGHHKPQKR